MDEMSRSEGLAAGDGRSTRTPKIKDGLCPVAQRLAWLADGKNWDGTLPPPKPLPPAPGATLAPTRSRGIEDGSRGGEHAPRWDGQVTGKFAAEAIPVAKAVSALHETSTKSDRCSNEGETFCPTTSSVQCIVSGTSHGRNDELIAGDGSTKDGHSMQDTLDMSPSAQFGRHSWLPENDAKHLLSEPGRKGDAVLLEDGDDDTAAEDGHSSDGDNNDGERLYDEALDASYKSQADLHANNSSDSLRMTPAADDIVSELSCLEGSIALSAAGDDAEIDEQPRDEDSAHDSSSASSIQGCSASPTRDDIGAAHLAQLLRERRRWKLRAFESEHELASVRALESREEAGAADTHNSTALMVQASESSSEMLSDMSAVESGFEVHDRWQTSSGSEEPSWTLSCASGRLSVREEPRPSFVRGVSATTGSQSVVAALPTTDCSPAVRGRRDTPAITHDDRGDQYVDGDRNHGIVCGDGLGTGEIRRGRAPGTNRLDRLADDDDDSGVICDGREQVQSRADVHRRLREEVGILKEKLRETELKQAAAEATAVSNLQRARAAEMARDVKEIQIRNLEIRLARQVNEVRHGRNALAQGRDGRDSGEGENADDGGMKLHLFRQHVEPLSPVAQDTARPLPRAYERFLRNHHTAAPREAVHTGLEARDEAGARDDLANGGGRAALERFRHSCAILGAKAARAGGGAMSAAAAVAREAAKEALQSATAAATGGNAGAGGESGGDGLGIAANGRSSQGATDEGTIEEYWGSDYCTSV